MSFFLLLLVNALLFIRPAEVFESFGNLPLFQVVFMAAMLSSLGPMLEQLSWANLGRNPVTACLVGLGLAIAASQLARFSLWDARASLMEFGQAVAFYLLFVAVLNTFGRYESYLRWLAGSIACMAGLALLHEFNFVQLPALEAIEQGDGIDGDTGEATVVRRLRGTGIFHDPNDLAMILVTGVTICVFFARRATHVANLAGWLLLAFMLLFATYRTQSRGGMLSLLIAASTLLICQYGWRKSLAPLAVCVALAGVVFAGRMTDVDAVFQGTGQLRIQVWSAGLELFKQNPIFGVGYGTFVDHVYHVAHNSFLHCFTELGFVGGALFLGQFLGAFATLSSVRAQGDWIRLRETDDRIVPYLYAILLGNVVAMLTLSRSYVLSTYLGLALVTAYARLWEQNSFEPALKFDFQFFRRTTVASVALLFATYLFVRWTARWT